MLFFTSKLNNISDMSVDALKKRLTKLSRDSNRSIRISFVASTSSNLLWKFVPSQEEVFLAPGETSLAFFKAKNLTDRPIIGIGMLYAWASCIQTRI